MPTMSCPVLCGMVCTLFTSLLSYFTDPSFRHEQLRYDMRASTSERALSLLAEPPANIRLCMQQKLGGLASWLHNFTNNSMIDGISL